MSRVDMVSAYLDSDVTWLSLTNIILGLFILLCCILVGWSVVREMRRRVKEKRDLTRVPDEHLAGLKDLGVTLQDGGRRIDEMEYRHFPFC